MKYKTIKVLPQYFQENWLAQVHSAQPTEKGVFRLVGIRRTEPNTFEEKRIIVLVVDENGFAIPSVDVAFSYSTAEKYILSQDFLWTPPPPQKAFIVPTQGSGQIDQVQGSVVEKDSPGGVTVYILEAEYSSDYITGAGALADHTGIHLTFQLKRTGISSIQERLIGIEKRLYLLEIDRKTVYDTRNKNELLKQAIFGHIHQGKCPDGLDNFATRDENCPGCQSITSLEVIL